MVTMISPVAGIFTIPKADKDSTDSKLSANVGDRFRAYQYYNNLKDQKVFSNIGD